MAATIRGSTVSWGCIAETNCLVQNFEYDDKVDEVEVRNEAGEVAAHIVYNRYKEFSCEYFPLSTTTTDLGGISPGSLYSFLGLTDSADKIITSVKTNRENQNAKRMTVSGKVFPLVTT